MASGIFWTIGSSRGAWLFSALLIARYKKHARIKKVAPITSRRILAPRFAPELHLVLLFLQ